MVSSIPVEYKWFTNRFTWSIDGGLKGTTNQGQSGLCNNGNEEVLFKSLEQ